MPKRLVKKPIQWWKRLSVSKKLYGVVGIMAVLIALELFTLLFAMNVLSAVRAFVGGEGLWSKAQKNAVVELQKYINSRDESHYRAFKENLKVNFGDRQARLEMMKPNPDPAVITKGFVAGGNHPNDVPSMITLMTRFYWVSYISRAIEVWGKADNVMDELSQLGERVHHTIRYQKIASTSPTGHALVNELSEINDRLTLLENEFSYTLGEASRWLESTLMHILLICVLTVESTGLFLTITFTRSLSRVLGELNAAARDIGNGDFTKKVPIRSYDELGELAEAINQMTANLRTAHGERNLAREASEVKSLFLANMSHEIRTPLGAILGFLELLRNPDLRESERSHYLSVARRAGSNLGTIINDILDISKVEAGKLEVKRTLCSLGEILKDLRLILQTRCEQKGVYIRIEPAGEVPDLVHTDPARLYQILLNIIGNAIKFTEHGGVDVSYCIRDGFLEFSVRDTGIGISREEISKLFQPFSQVDLSIRKAHGGTGLGLVLSRRLAHLLGGDVTLSEAQTGKGSTFLVRIEYKAQKGSGEQVPGPVSAPPPPADLTLQGKKILLVEDNSDNQLLIERMLSLSGAEVEISPNGQKGMEKALEGRFDLILMDMQMPVMDGYTATSELRKRDFLAPIIGLTAHAMKEDVEKSLISGCNAVLTKPLKSADLIKLVKKYCA